MVAPGTMPPPSTRSNSRMPLGQCATLSALICVIGRAARESLTRAGLTCGVAGAWSIASRTVPQLWHSAQRPAHFGVLQPHSVHR
jgi:hypothetical protein